MSFFNCVSNRFLCHEKINELQNANNLLTQEIKEYEKNKPKWSPFDTFKPIWEIGKRISVMDVLTIWKNQMGTDLTQDIIVASGNRIPWIRGIFSNDVMYAIPRRIMQQTISNTAYINQIPYDGFSKEKDIRPEYDHICKDYSTHFLGLFETCPHQLGYHMAYVGMVMVPGHRRNIYINSDDMKFWMVERTLQSRQWLSDPTKNNGDKVSRLVD